MKTKQSLWKMPVYEIVYDRDIEEDTLAYPQAIDVALGHEARAGA